VTVLSPHRYFLVYPLRRADSPKLDSLRTWLKREIARDEGGAAFLKLSTTRKSERGNPAKAARAIHRGT